MIMHGKPQYVDKRKQVESNFRFAYKLRKAIFAP